MTNPLGIPSSKLKGHRFNRHPLVLRHEMNVSLRRPSIQMPDKRCYLIPCFSLTHQTQSERIPQGMIGLYRWIETRLTSQSMSSARNRPGANHAKNAIRATRPQIPKAIEARPNFA